MATRTQLSAGDLEVILALSRARTLAAAGLRLGLDASTVFRAVQRAEKGMGQRLFERSTRSGYHPTELALRLAAHAEAVEREIEAARSAARSALDQPVGLVRVSAIDAVLNHLVVPALADLLQKHPQLHVDFGGSNDLANLTQREVDLAVRSTARPPDHLVGRRFGRLQYAVYAQAAWARRTIGPRHGAASAAQLAALPWVGVDAGMPDHPGVAWRKRQLPRTELSVQANSMLAVAEAVDAGMGAAVLAAFHAAQRPGLVAITGPLEDCHVDLWLLSHPESRHQPRIAAVARHLMEAVPPLLDRLQNVSTTRPKGRSSTK